MDIRYGLSMVEMMVFKIQGLARLQQMQSYSYMNREFKQTLAHVPP